MLQSGYSTTIHLYISLYSDKIGTINEVINQSSDKIGVRSTDSWILTRFCIIFAICNLPDRARPGLLGKICTY
jgi:hypothetical protein